MKIAEMEKLKQVTTYSIQLKPNFFPQLRRDLEQKGFLLKKTPYAFFSATKNKLNITLYKSGKLLLQGKDTPEFIEYYLEPVLLKKINLGYSDIINDLESHEARIGVDESGKGDYFGPLVIAGVHITPEIEKKLVEIGVKDSKCISDKKIMVLREKIIEMCPYSVVVIGPQRYNQLYDKIGNLNRMLAWGHARVIENVLSKVNCDRVIIDKFGNNKFILDALMKRGKKIPVVQKVRAESDCAVAAASVLARGEFLRRLAKLSKELGIKLPKGASKIVEQSAQDLITKKGFEILQSTAKIHFKTTKKVILGID